MNKHNTKPEKDKTEEVNSSPESSENGQPRENRMAQNPNPRANENIEHAPFEREQKGDQSVGSEITDGEAG
jgi:hypothetical protein